MHGRRQEQEEVNKWSRVADRFISNCRALSDVTNSSQNRPTVKNNICKNHEFVEDYCVESESASKSDWWLPSQDVIDLENTFLFALDKAVLDATLTMHPPSSVRKKKKSTLKKTLMNACYRDEYKLSKNVLSDDANEKPSLLRPQLSRYESRYCGLCGVHFDSSTGLLCHKESRSHRDKVAELEMASRFNQKVHVNDRPSPSSPNNTKYDVFPGCSLVNEMPIYYRVHGDSLPKVRLNLPGEFTYCRHCRKSIQCFSDYLEHYKSLSHLRMARKRTPSASLDSLATSFISSKKLFNTRRPS